MSFRMRGLDGGPDRHAWLAGCALVSLFGVAGVLEGCASDATHVAAAHPSRSARRAEHQLAEANAEPMPSDLGAPLPQPPADASARQLSIDMPIGSIAAKPDGRAVLDKDLPGLCERPEFTMFKSMSLKALAGMSGGKISTAKLNQVQADLLKLNSPQSP